MATAESAGYEQLLAQASQLPPAEQLRLVEDLAALVRQRMAPAPAQSVTALRGLGKEVWQGIDAQEYVDRERAAWDG
jgi:hypothetical protein